MSADMIEQGVRVWRDQPPIDPRRETVWQYQARILRAVFDASNGENRRDSDAPLSNGDDR